MISVRRALALSFAERYLLVMVALAGNIFIARLLKPEEIGIYSVSLAVISIAQVLRDFGIGSFLIQERHLSDDHIRTAFGMSLMLGASLFIAVSLGAPLAGRFYGEPRMIETLRIGAVNFLVLPFCTVSLALLRREMAFDRLILVNVFAAVIGFGLTISLALLGNGPNSMAAGGVATSLATGVGAWLARSPRRMLYPALSQWRAMLNFGAQSSAAGIVTTISMDINDLAVGRILGFAPVAMLSRAYGLVNLFHRDVMAAVRNVAYPAFAKAHREGESIEGRYVAAVTSVTVLAWPFYGFAGAFSLEVIRLMFGSQWDAAARLVPFLCLAGALAATSSLILNAITAIGRFDLVARSEYVLQPLRACLIVAAALFFRSLMACALAYLIFCVIYTPCIYKVKARCIPNDLNALRQGLYASLKVTVISLALPTSIAAAAGWHRAEPVALTTLILAAAFTVIGWLFAVRICNHPVMYDPLFLRFSSRIPGFN